MTGGERRGLVCPLPLRISEVVPSWGRLFGAPCPKSLLERVGALSLWQAPQAEHQETPTVPYRKAKLSLCMLEHNQTEGQAPRTQDCWPFLIGVKVR